MEYQLIAPEFPLKENAPVVERVLANRGIKPENINHYLNTDDNDILDPSLIFNIKEGAQMLIKHISQNDKVLI